MNKDTLLEAFEVHREIPLDVINAESETNSTYGNPRSDRLFPDRNGCFGILNVYIPQDTVHKGHQILYIIDEQKDIFDMEKVLDSIMEIVGIPYVSVELLRHEERPDLLGFLLESRVECSPQVFFTICQFILTSLRLTTIEYKGIWDTFRSKNGDGSKLTNIKDVALFYILYRPLYASGNEYTTTFYRFAYFYGRDMDMIDEYFSLWEKFFDELNSTFENDLRFAEVFGEFEYIGQSQPLDMIERFLYGDLIYSDEYY